LPALCIIWNQKSAARSKCPSGTSQRDKFDDPNLPGEMQVTVTLKKVSVGTELDIAQAGVPDVIPPEACYLGWQESLRNLARLVEPEINQ
jgi:hypothetical protein